MGPPLSARVPGSGRPSIDPTRGGVNASRAPARPARASSAPRPRRSRRGAFPRRARPTLQPAAIAAACSASLQPPSGPTRSAAGRGGEAPPGTALPRGSSRKRCAATIPGRAPPRSATGPSTRGQRARSDCSAASSTTRREARHERPRPRGAPACARSTTSSSEAAPSSVAFSAIHDSRSGAHGRHAEVDRRQLLGGGRSDAFDRDASRRDSRCGPSRRGRRPRARFRRRERPRSPRTSRRARAWAALSRPSTQVSPAAGRLATTKRAPGTGSTHSFSAAAARELPAAPRASCAEDVRLPLARDAGEQDPPRASRPAPGARAASGRISSASMFASTRSKRPAAAASGPA